MRHTDNTSPGPDSRFGHLNQFGVHRLYQSRNQFSQWYLSVHNHWKLPFELVERWFVMVFAILQRRVWVEAIDKVAVHGRFHWMNVMTSSYIMDRWQV